MAYTNSSLVTYTNLTKNKTTNRTHAIDTITIHCYVAQVTAKQGCDYFATTKNQCSANYVVGKDGSIGLSVEEKDRSWCSSSASNDHRAITIEVASDTTAPYAVTDAAFSALISLVADVCKRNNIKKLLWCADKSLVGDIAKQNMTVHRWFANKECPGEYLYTRMGDIADKVNAKLDSSTTSSTLYRVQVGAFSKKDNATKLATELKSKGYEAIVVEG
jgi:N-acetyl-anhydromuramyl-L-alanine amidase AmpD